MQTTDAVLFFPPELTDPNANTRAVRSALYFGQGRFKVLPIDAPEALAAIRGRGFTVDEQARGFVLHRKACSEPTREDGIFRVLVPA